jgi:opine dehydrogenase
MSKPRIAVLGAGNAGHAHAAHLSMRGFDVSLVGWTEDEETLLKPIRQRGGIEAAEGGTITGFGKLNPENVTVSVRDGVKGRDIIILVVPAYGQKYFLEKLTDCIEDGQVIGIIPDHFGTLLFNKMLKDKGVKKDVHVFGSQSMVYGARLMGPAKVFIGAFKDRLLSASLPASATRKALAKFREIYPQYVPGKNLIEVNLANPYIYIIPFLCLANMARVGLKKEFQIYIETTPEMARIIEDGDREREELCKAFGVDLPPAVDMIKTMYSSAKLKGKDVHELFTMNPTFFFPKGPTTLEDRFILEPVPYALVPLISFCEELGIKCPTAKAITHLLGIALGRDFFREGVTAEKLGLKGLSPKEIIRLVG